MLYSDPSRKSAFTMSGRAAVILAILSAALPSTLQYQYETKNFTTKLDHFTFTTDAKFNLRYLINDSWWDPELTTSPIFFYTGNEGDITLFSDNAGLVWELAPQFNALVVFAEHRYYGESLPFGDLSFTEPKYSGYLSSAQALADYIDLIYHLKTVYVKRDNAPIPVIAFGGSYGGMLAAWIRMKYPSVISGSLAASAPIWQYTGMTDCDAFNKVATRAFQVSGTKKCPQLIKKSWSAIDSLNNSDGLSWMTKTFKTCQPLTSGDELKSWLVNMYGNLAMANYPYPANFLAELPGHPVKAVCQGITRASNPSEPKVLLQALFEGISVFFNYTGNSKCLDVGQDNTPDLGTLGWAYQSCTEMVMPMCDRGDTMFEEGTWDIEQVSDNCYEEFQVRPNVNYVRNLYGGKKLTYATNIIFSNGFLDPWSAGGVLKSVSKGTYTTGPMPGAAHHLDLRASNRADPPAVKKARDEYVKLFRKWVEEIL